MFAQFTEIKEKEWQYSWNNDLQGLVNFDSFGFLTLEQFWPFWVFEFGFY
jgi:hypothetical protein